eukprot:g17116.t1
MGYWNPRHIGTITTISTFLTITFLDPNERGDLRERKLQLAPWLTLSATEVLEIASPPGQGNLITVEEKNRCFRTMLKTDATPEISVYQLDKILSKAKASYDEACVSDCFMLKPDSELSPTERATRHFLDALDRKLLERFTRGRDNLHNLKAVSFALSPDSIPAEKDLASNLAQIGGRPETGNMTRSVAFRALALARHHRHMQRASTIKARSALLAQQCWAAWTRSTWWPEGSRPVQSAKQRSKGFVQRPTRKAFRVAAFIECLVKLALHRLGSKGQLELQRGAPTWWKCTWLLNLLGIRFMDSRSTLAGRGMLGRPFVCLRQDERTKMCIESVKDKEHHEILWKLAAQEKPAAKTKDPELCDLDFWWYRMYQSDRPQFLPPLQRLVRSIPDLFHPTKAEAPILVPEDRKGICPECQEGRSPSGWGTPGCLSCSEIENSEVSEDMSCWSPTSELNDESGNFRLPFAAEEVAQLGVIT